MQNKSETYGYITGISFANQLGLTTQMPAVIEVVTNREATNGRMIKEQLSQVSSILTGATAKKLIEWRLIYEFK